MQIIVSQKEIATIVNKINSSAKIHQDELDEMAIPTYLHQNRSINWLFWSRLGTIIALASQKRFSAVLDFGCGIGILLPTLCSISNVKVHATDLHPEFAIELARVRKLDVAFHEAGDIMNGLVSNSLDLIIAADSMEHLENPAEYLEIFKDKLTANGRLIISGPTENWIYRLGRIVAGFGGKSGYHHTNVYILKDIIMGAGFKCTFGCSLPFHFPVLFKVYVFEKE